MPHHLHAEEPPPATGAGRGEGACLVVCNGAPQLPHRVIPAALDAPHSGHIPDAPPQGRGFPHFTQKLPSGAFSEPHQAHLATNPPDEE